MGNKSIVQKIIDEFYNDEIQDYEFEHMMENEGVFSFEIMKIKREKLETIKTN
jgi:hypothetical protein